ncbi:antiterminator Q family protein [Candidatus Fukatsuia symbiotica]|uniref:Antitermination protein Q n=1 Tax=Candidatus Fukatsuia symbiotica TaxID=1878942 RepID=A0A2U8I373_9GAMM|nr:antiterminator Q family protein [Candidatus Fukatsuia symbiotica]AWK13553.1 antitermination protein Q [Candidatus Fukatsuia symbiotica]MEA9445345.1 antiterminator Q family protein [Candidatus Fukatsuia symbiotica]
MRDINLILERWGTWARYSSRMDYSPIAAGFKGLFPASPNKTISCSDDDGMIIDHAVGRLKAVRKPEELTLILAHYVYCIPKRVIAKKWKCSESEIRRKIQVAEGFIDGCLAMKHVCLHMDPYVQKKGVQTDIIGKINTYASGSVR